MPEKKERKRQPRKIELRVTNKDNTISKTQFESTELAMDWLQGAAEKYVGCEYEVVHVIKCSRVTTETKYNL